MEEHTKHNFETVDNLRQAAKKVLRDRGPAAASHFVMEKVLPEAEVAAVQQELDEYECKLRVLRSWGWPPAADFTGDQLEED